MADILPRPALLSSRGQWQGIYLEHHCQPPGEIPEHSHAEHLIVVSLDRNRVERWLDGHLEKEITQKGNFCLIPSNLPHGCNWQQEAEILLLAIAPDRISQIARESVNTDRIELMPRSLMNSDDPFIAQIASLLKKDLEEGCPLGSLYGESLSTALFVRLLKHYATVEPTIRHYRDGLPKHKLQQVLDYIHAHLEQEVGLSDLAEIADMSQYYFCRLFSQSMGISPYQYVLQQRVERAKILLKNQTNSLADIALQCGFANQSHFTKHFRKQAGITPKAYREV